MNKPSAQQIPGTAPHEYNLSDYGITHDTLKQMLRREDTLRLSPDILAQYKAFGHDGYVRITTALQAQVSREFGLNEEVGIMLLRTAESFARDATELAEMVSLSLYRRHNRCVDGTVQVGDLAPVLQCPLHLLDAALTKVPLFAHLLSGAAYERVVRNYHHHMRSNNMTNTTETFEFRSINGSHQVSRNNKTGNFDILPVDLPVSPVPLILFAGSYT